jgi:membrane protease YdiL (CAAX protease family)
MSHLQLDKFVLVVLSSMISTILLAMLSLWGWAFVRLVRGVPLLSETPILPYQPARWSGRTVFAVILLYFCSNIAVGVAFGVVSRVVSHAPKQEQAETKPTTKESTEGEEHEKTGADKKAERAKTSSPFNAMLLTSIASLLFVAILPSVLRRSAGISIAELGVTSKDASRQVSIGLAAAFLSTPAIYAIQSLAARHWEVNEHPVQEMMVDQMSLGVAILALVSTVVIAPLVEETLFRGIIQGWLTRVFTPPPPPPSPEPRSENHAEPTSAQELGSEPVIVESVSDVPDALPPAPSEPTGPNPVCIPAVLLTSLVFAGVHAPQWPAPIGIFFLSVVLGVVYQRTGSLLTAMVMHGAFNGCSTLLLLQGVLVHSIEGPKPKVPEISPELEPAIRAVIDWWSCFF